MGVIRKETGLDSGPLWPGPAQGRLTSPPLVRDPRSCPVPLPGLSPFLSLGSLACHSPWESGAQVLCSHPEAWNPSSRWLHSSLVGDLEQVVPGASVASVQERWGHLSCLAHYSWLGDPAGVEAGRPEQQVPLELTGALDPAAGVPCPAP